MRATVSNLFKAQKSTLYGSTTVGQRTDSANKNRDFRNYPNTRKTRKLENEDKISYLESSSELSQQLVSSPRRARKQEKDISCQTKLGGFSNPPRP